MTFSERALKFTAVVSSFSSRRSNKSTHILGPCDPLSSEARRAQVNFNALKIGEQNKNGSFHEKKLSFCALGISEARDCTNWGAV